MLMSIQFLPTLSSPNKAETLIQLLKIERKSMAKNCCQGSLQGLMENPTDVFHTKLQLEYMLSTKSSFPPTANLK